MQSFPTLVLTVGELVRRDHWLHHELFRNRAFEFPRYLDLIVRHECRYALNLSGPCEVPMVARQRSSVCSKGPPRNTSHFN